MQFVTAGKSASDFAIFAFSSSSVGGLPRHGRQSLGNRAQTAGPTFHCRLFSSGIPLQKQRRKPALRKSGPYSSIFLRL